MNLILWNDFLLYLKPDVVSVKVKTESMKDAASRAWEFNLWGRFYW